MTSQTILCIELSETWAAELQPTGAAVLKGLPTTPAISNGLEMGVGDYVRPGMCTRPISSRPRRDRDVHPFVRDETETLETETRPRRDPHCPRRDRDRDSVIYDLKIMMDV